MKCLTLSSCGFHIIDNELQVCINNIYLTMRVTSKRFVLSQKYMRFKYIIFACQGQLRISGQISNYLKI